MSKKQWKNVTENMSLQFSTRSNWSQEEPDHQTVDLSEIRSVLPTKTSATRQISDLESIPANGPFLLTFSNIPFESSETDLKNFFRLYDPIKIQKFETSKGAGFIEFKDLANLTNALTLHEKVFVSRPIRLKIANKDDISRLQGGGNQRNRMQNQSRNPQQSSSLEDSDNWRSKRSAPPPAPVDNSGSANRDKQNWRERSSADNSDNWRRPKQHDSGRNGRSGNVHRAGNQNSDDSRATIAAVAMTHSDKLEAEKDFFKKPSIFGGAKPVDTAVKDQEIEKKMEMQRKHVSEDSKGDSNQKQGAWKKSTTQHLGNQNPPATESSQSASSSSTEKSALPEWRHGPRSVPIKTRQSASESLATNKSDQSIPSDQQKPGAPEPQLAPIPKNFWEERKLKSKEVTVASVPVAIETPITILERNNSAVKPPQQVQEKAPRETSVNTSSLVSMTTTNPTTSSGLSNVASGVQPEKSASPKPPVVISANGPFIDPKIRTPHHSTSVTSTSTGLPSTDSRSPTAVPVTSRDSSDLKQQSTPVKSCDAHNPWSKGPPRGLIDKA